MSFHIYEIGAAKLPSHTLNPWSLCHRYVSKQIQENKYLKTSNLHHPNSFPQSCSSAHAFSTSNVAKRKIEKKLNGLLQEV